MLELIACYWRYLDNTIQNSGMKIFSGRFLWKAPPDRIWKNAVHQLLLGKVRQTREAQASRAALSVPWHLCWARLKCTAMYGRQHLLLTQAPHHFNFSLKEMLCSSGWEDLWWKSPKPILGGEIKNNKKLMGLMHGSFAPTTPPSPCTRAPFSPAAWTYVERLLKSGGEGPEGRSS